MPVGFYYPDVFINHNGVTIFYVYANDNQTDGIRLGRYGYSEYCTDEGLNSFDIQDLPNYQEQIPHIVLLKEAIDKGWITTDSVTTKGKLKEVSEDTTEAVGA